MSIFEPVSFGWKGKTYVVPATEVLRLIAAVEEVITLADLSASRPPMARLSSAFGIALRYAGATVADEEIYKTIFENGGASVVSSAVNSLISMMIPPSTLQDVVVGADKSAPKKPRAASKKNLNRKN